MSALLFPRALKRLLRIKIRLVRFPWKSTMIFPPDLSMGYIAVGDRFRHPLRVSMIAFAASSSLTVGMRSRSFGSYVASTPPRISIPNAFCWRP
jgi:hypothetical protein